MDTALTALSACASGSELQVDIVSSALPADASTETTLSAMSAKLPSALGQTTKSGSVSVTVASDQVVTVASRDVALTQVFSTNTIVGPVAIGTSVDTNGYEAAGAFVSTASCATGGTIYLESSIDNTNWARSADQIFVMMSGSAANYSVSQTKTPFRYLRLYAASPLDISGGAAWFSLK